MSINLDRLVEEDEKPIVHQLLQRHFSPEEKVQCESKRILISQKEKYAIYKTVIHAYSRQKSKTIEYYVRFSEEQETAEERQTKYKIWEFFSQAETDAYREKHIGMGYLPNIYQNSSVLIIESKGQVDLKQVFEPKLSSKAHELARTLVQVQIPISAEILNQETLKELEENNIIKINHNNKGKKEVIGLREPYTALYKSFKGFETLVQDRKKILHDATGLFIDFMEDATNLIKRKRINFLPELNKDNLEERIKKTCRMLKMDLKSEEECKRLMDKTYIPKLLIITNWIIHGDMLPQNVVVNIEKEKWDLSLIDIENVSWSNPYLDMANWTEYLHLFFGITPEERESLWSLLYGQKNEIFEFVNITEETEKDLAINLSNFFSYGIIQNQINMLPQRRGALWVFETEERLKKRQEAYRKRLCELLKSGAADLNQDFKDLHKLLLSYFER
jgi:hypothetical protein